MGYLCPTRPEIKKSEPTEDIFKRFQAPEKKFRNFFINLNNIFSFLWLLYFWSELVTFCIKKTQFLTLCFDIKTWGIFLSIFLVYSVVSLRVYIKKLGYLCQTRPEIENRSRRRSLFRGSKTSERDIDNLTSYPAPRQ